MGQGPWERESAGVVYAEERLSDGGRIRKGRMCSRPICVVEIKLECSWKQTRTLLKGVWERDLANGIVTCTKASPEVMVCFQSSYIPSSPEIATLNCDILDISCRQFVLRL